MKFYYKMPLSLKKLNKIRILAFDMDDTLLDAHGKLSEANKAAIMRAMEKGYHVVIATGRVLAALPKDVLAVEGVQYAVTSNGARITDMHTGKILFENLITPEAVDAVDPYLHDEDVMLEIFFDDAVYAQEKDLARLAYFGRTSEKSQEYVLTTRKPVDDILALLEANKDRMENINLITANDEKRLRWLAELKKVPGITACSSTPNNIEIGGLHVSKADALEELADYLGTGIESVMAFGDSSNDEQMVVRAGIGVAMGNSVPELLERADYITLTNEDDGVAYALENLLGI
ncbi:MAG: HAD family phosphatase [Firmicutes bacterium]|nr:HAD family phosphatase [Bacillota bacterium]